MLTPWYPTRENRYNGVFVREYARAVQKRCNVVVLHCRIVDSNLQASWSVERERDEQLAFGVPTYRVRFRPYRIRRLSYPRYLTSVYRALRQLSQKHGRIDLIHAHVHSTGWAALLAGRLLRVPVILSEHSTAFGRNLLSRSEILQARVIYRLADAVLPVSEALRETLAGFGVKTRFQVVPNVVDTSLFNFVEGPSVSRSKLRLLAVSSLVENKGLPFLFEALVQVPWRGRQWRLDLIGDGPEASILKSAVRNLGLESRVIFHGPRSKAEIAKKMQEADFFVLPSLVETFSVATAEAMASGLPVVVTRCGGPEGFVTKEAGTIVEPGDAKSLAEAITVIMERLPDFNRRLISQRAREQFSGDRIGSMLHELYTRLVRGGALSARNLTGQPDPLVNSNRETTEMTSPSLRL